MLVKREFVPSFRKIGDLTIYFVDKKMVLAWDKYGYIALHRVEDGGNGYYSHQWRPMLERLYRQNSLSSIYDVARIAERFDIEIFSRYQKPPNIPPCTLERPSIYKQGVTMGIFRPTDTHDYNIVVYSKYCIRCNEEESGQLIELETWALHNDLDVIVIRTAYRPADHNRAAEIYGSPDYPTFVVYDDVKTLKDFVKMIKDTKNKMVVNGKTKGGKGDLQGLSKTEDAKRKDSCAGAVSKVKNKNEE